jgi:hypothetical protein
MRPTKLCSVLFAICLGVAHALAAAPAPAAPALIPANQLQADLSILRRAYEELHPGLYRYNSREQMAASFKALEAELSRDLTLQQAYLAFSGFLAKVKCGHTYANFFNQPDPVVEALFKGQDKVPFYFRWIDRRMIVTRNFSDDPGLVAGTEVASINGVPAGTILDRLLTVARADGSNDAKRVSYLEVLGESDYEAFDVFFPMFFPPQGTRFELRLKDPFTAKERTASVQALSYDQRLAARKAKAEKQQSGAEKGWEFRFLDPNTAYLRMPTWSLYDSKWDWKQFLDSTFDQLARNKTAHLIVDLRGNEGGLGDVGNAILSRLIQQDLRTSGFKRLVRYQKVPEDLRPYLDTWDKSFFDWGAAASDLRDGFYRLRREGEAENGDLIKVAARPFEGKTFVLVDASNSSATFRFSEVVQQNRLATLVGQPTGGNQRGINGGAFFFLRLPNSKIEVDLPLIGYFPGGEPADAGLQPDLLVQPKVEDIARGIDPEMSLLKERLRISRLNLQTSKMSPSVAPRAELMTPPAWLLGIMRRNPPP